MEDELLPTELQARLETSYARIAEDEGLISDLTDAEARELLAWAQAEVRRLVQQTATLGNTDAEADLSAKVAHLRRHLRRLAKASANEADPADYLHTHLTPPNYPDETPVSAAPDTPGTVSSPPTAAPRIAPDSGLETPAIPPNPLPVDERPKPPAFIPAFFRRWFGKKDQT